MRGLIVLLATCRRELQDIEAVPESYGEMVGLEYVFRIHELSLPTIATSFLSPSPVLFSALPKRRIFLYSFLFDVIYLSFSNDIL